MALPVQNSPIYTLKIPTTGKICNYRPFLVKDEKALRIAENSEDVDVMINTLKDVIRSCIVEEIDVNSLFMLDLEYIFTQIRAKSTGEITEFVLSCGHCDAENNKFSYSLDVTKIEVTKHKDHSCTIPLYDNVGVIMKYPTIDVVKKIGAGLNDPMTIIDVVIDCIESIYTDTEVYTSKEQSKDELREWIEKLRPDQFSKLEYFFETMPKYQHTIEFICPACKTKNSLTLEGIQDFF